MRAFALAVTLHAALLWCQGGSEPVRSSTDVQAAITSALLGRWTGVLEYRDYSEPETSTSRVQLPTWLTVRQVSEGLAADYTYDDGPSKIVLEHSVLLLNTAAKTYTVLGSDETEQISTITGLDQLKNGLGTLILAGLGKDNNHPAEIRTTWTIRRNLLSWLEEVRSRGSSGPFVFRHRYTFTRAEPPTQPSLGAKP